jgi:hypothetical protein
MVLLEAVLAPGLKSGNRYRVGQVEAALTFSHRQPQALLGWKLLAQFRRQSFCF